jgi:hypothetical protein
MILISPAPARAGALSCAVVAWLCAWAPPAGAVRVDGIFADTVPVTGAGQEATTAAFAEALRRVVVKATGRAAAGQDPALLGRLGDVSALVQQYRRDAGGRLWVQFDAAAVRRALEAAGYPAWGEERPVSVVWLAYDAGDGERDVLGSGAAEGGAAAALRRELLAAADARAVPVVLPLRDSQDLAAVSFADVWGDFPDAVARASVRYQADAILVGRARLFPPGMTDVRWTLVAGGERAEWRGSLADGPAGLAERLGQRLGTTADAGGSLVRLAVDGVASFEQYGALLAYLQGLDVVGAVSVARARGQSVEFDLALRGDRERLEKALAVRRVVEPAASDPASGAAPAGALRYRVGTAL